MGRRLALVVNPTAGKGASGTAADVVQQRLAVGGVAVELLVGRDGPHAEQLCRNAAADGVDGIVAVGGDGMAHLALQACAGTPTAFGLVPCGTGNDRARALHLPLRDPVRSADLLL